MILLDSVTNLGSPFGLLSGGLIKSTAKLASALQRMQASQSCIIGHRVVAEELHHGPELSCYWLRLATFPIGDCVGAHAHQFTSLRLQEVQFTPPLLQVLA